LIISLVVCGVAILVAALAIVQIRRASKRLDRLRESYWDLRYEFGQLQARVSRLEAADRVEAAPAPDPAGAANFVPLSSLRR
jgi:hypothetical protein